MDPGDGYTKPVRNRQGDSDWAPWLQGPGGGVHTLLWPASCSHLGSRTPVYMRSCLNPYHCSHDSSRIFTIRNPFSWATWCLFLQLRDKLEHMAQSSIRSTHHPDENMQCNYFQKMRHLDCPFLHIVGFLKKHIYGLSILSLHHMYPGDHLGRHLSSFNGLLLKCRFWYIRWVGGVRLRFCVSHKLPGRPVATLSEALIWTISQKKKVRNGEEASLKSHSQTGTGLKFKLRSLNCQAQFSTCVKMYIGRD